jgi:hypothetical protein
MFVRTHWELFPNNREITSDLVDELRDIALHAASGLTHLPLNPSSFNDDYNALPDSLTSRTSTALWNTEQNQIILNLMNNMNRNCFPNYAAVRNS